MNLSIRKFLIFNLLMTITVTVFITTFASYYMDKKEIDGGYDKLLTHLGHILEDFTSRNPLNPSLLSAFASVRAAESSSVLGALSPLTAATHHRYHFMIWTINGKLLLHSEGAPSLPFFPMAGLHSRLYQGKKWRIFSTVSKHQGYVFVTIEDYALRKVMVRHMMLEDVYLMLLIYPTSGIFVWLIISNGLKSIRFFAKEVAKRAADRLNPVNLAEVPVEIIPLVDELNKLFLRLKQAFEREQRFSADAAHELHTPLAALKTQAQVALRTTDPDERYQHLRQVIMGVDRCTHVIQQLLTLCRSSPETITPEHFMQLDFTKVTAEVIGLLAPSAVEKNIDIELIAPDEPCYLSANQMGVHTMIRNLVDNAIRYTPASGMIKVYVERAVMGLYLRVVDTGPGIPPELRSRALERFFRVLGTNVAGSGLGLAIVEQIAKLHKATIELKTPENTIGLEVVIFFPFLPLGGK